MLPLNFAFQSVFIKSNKGQHTQYLFDDKDEILILYLIQICKAVELCCWNGSLTGLADNQVGVNCQREDEKERWELMAG